MEAQQKHGTSSFYIDYIDAQYSFDYIYMKAQIKDHVVAICAYSF